MGNTSAQVVRWTDDIASIGPCVCAFGVFDGVHAGHRYLIARMSAYAGRLHVPSVVVTFDRDPDELFSHGSGGNKLLSNEDRIALLAAAHVDYVLVVPFTQALAELAPETFLDGVIGAFCKPRAIHVGCDFAFGAGAAGHVDDIERWGSVHGCDCVAYDLYRLAGAPVTSTRIREMLFAGQVCEASALLGRDPYVRGSVTHGRGEGHVFGFPTANVVVPETYATLADGVYAGYVLFDGARYPAAISVGTPPTFPDAPGRLECHILDFDGDLYGRDVEVVFVARLRDMMGFASEEELIATVSANIAWVSRNLR